MLLTRLTGVNVPTNNMMSNQRDRGWCRGIGDVGTGAADLDVVSQDVEDIDGEFEALDAEDNFEAEDKRMSKTKWQSRISSPSPTESISWAKIGPSPLTATPLGLHTHRSASTSWLWAKHEVDAENCPWVLTSTRSMKPKLTTPGLTRPRSEDAEIRNVQPWRNCSHAENQGCELELVNGGQAKSNLKSKS
ncbi:hypothetical protein ACFE04_001231 [Oxalis oulophora]